MFIIHTLYTERTFFFFFSKGKRFFFFHCHMQRYIYIYAYAKYMHEKLRRLKRPVARSLFLLVVIYIYLNCVQYPAPFFSFLSCECSRSDCCDPPPFPSSLFYFCCCSHPRVRRRRPLPRAGIGHCVGRTEGMSAPHHEEGEYDVLV